MERAYTNFVIKKQRTFTEDLFLGIVASFLIVLAAPFSIPLPFTPVPLVLQMNMVLFLALFIGRRSATMMVLSFLMQGMMGMPVFAGGAFGIANMIGPRGGYLLGYLIAAYLVGTLAEKSDKRPLTAFINMGLGNLAIYLCGYLWLVQYLGFINAAAYGLLPFVVTDTLKLILLGKVAGRFKQI